MKVIVDKSSLSTATARSQGAVSEKNLAHIGLRAYDDKLQLTAADRILVIYNAITSEVIDPGEVFVPARLFSDVVRELPDGQVKMEKTSQYLVIKAGENDEFVMKLPRIEEKKFQDAPVIDSDNCASIPSEKLRYIIEQVQFCVAHESPRNYGAVGFLHRPKKDVLRLVGTDGYRLSYSEIEMDLPENFLFSGLCLSKRALSELHRMCNEQFDEIEFSITEDQTTLMVSVPDYRIYVRLSVVKYPNYQGVLPASDLTPVDVPRTYFQSVTKRVLLASDKTRALQLCFSDSSLTLRSRTVGSSEGKEVIPLENYQNGNRELAINGKFLNDVFSTVESETVTLNFKTDEDPIVLIPREEPSNCHSLHVLVPIRES